MAEISSHSAAAPMATDTAMITIATTRPTVLRHPEPVAPVVLGSSGIAEGTKIAGAAGA
jgi:hypothetical protein